MITPYLCDLINDHRIVKRVWKIQVNMRVNFVSSKALEKLALFMGGVVT